MIFNTLIESLTATPSTPKELLQFMNKHIRYANYSKLKSPDDVVSSGSGSCHDQVMFELKELRRMGTKPKAIFFYGI